MTSHILSEDTQVILLLCGNLGQNRQAYPQPLTPVEYYNVAQWLQRQSLQPADLLGPLDASILSGLKGSRIDPERLCALLARGGALALIVETWTNKGLWVLSLSDEGYPQRWKDRLGRLAPPLIYGAGDQTLLSSGGLAVVGSRDVDDEGIAVTHMVASLCAQQGLQVISGGARGVDSEVMFAALSEGGCVVCVLAGSLARAAVSGKYREALRAGDLVLASPYDPNAAFNVGNAMGRNKYVYCLSDWGLVISSAFKKGGTWAGAVENLKHKWVPLFVRDDDNVPVGNYQLIKCGGVKFNRRQLTDADAFGKLLSSYGDTHGDLSMLSTKDTDVDTAYHQSSLHHWTGSD